MMQKDEELLLRPWLLYHGYMFGFENLYVYDNGSAIHSVTETLREFSDVGVNVDFAFHRPEDFDNKGNVIGDKIMEFRQANLYDVAVPLDCDEFLAVNHSDIGITCHRGQVHGELDRIHHQGVTCRTGFCLDNKPGELELFRYSNHTKSVVLVRDFTGIDHGFHEADMPEGLDYGRTTLIHIHMHFKPFEHLLRSARDKLRPYVDTRDAEALRHFDGVGMHLKDYFFVSRSDYYRRLDNHAAPLLRFSGLTRAISVFMNLGTFRAAWEDGRPEDPGDQPLAIDLERCPFNGSAYLEANPDLRSLELDALWHFVIAGYFEARLMDMSEAARLEVVDRLAQIRDRRRDGRSGYLGLALAMSRVGRSQEADALLFDAMARFGATMELMREHALLAQYDNSPDEASRRWASFRGRFPDHPDGYLYGALALRQVHDAAEAENVVLMGLTRFPDHQELRIEHAEIVMERRDFVRATNLWNGLLVNDPDNDMLRARIGEASYRLALSDAESDQGSHTDDGEGPSRSSQTLAPGLQHHERLTTEAPSDLREFFMGFESLGHSCEFGLLQRHFGAEPIGLFRWNSIHAPRLLEALTAQFEGIDDPDNLALESSRGEYVLRDMRYATAMHTFALTTEADAGMLTTQLVKRMSFLRRKMITDLRGGEKIFVHLDDQWRSDHQLHQLHHSLRAYGSATLLYVRACGVPTKIGTAEQVDDGLVLGYIGRLGRDSDDNWNIDIESWVKVCRAAAACRNAATMRASDSLREPGVLG